MILVQDSIDRRLVLDYIININALEWIWFNFYYRELSIQWAMSKIEKKEKLVSVLIKKYFFL